MTPRLEVIGSSDSTKRKITKSRNGCLTCKKKRLKCDETKPSCTNCVKKKINCGGYATNFKWRSFKDTSEDSFFIANNEQKKRKSSEVKIEPPNAENLPKPDSLRRHLELASISVTGKSIKDIKIENDLISKGLNPDTYKKQKRDVKKLINDNDVIGGDTKMRRSHSHTNEYESNYSNLLSHSPLMRRSFSANTSTPLDLQSIRSEFSKMSSNGLDSLAEVAVDEMRRSPSVSSERPILRNNAFSPSAQEPFSPNFSEFFNKSDQALSIKLHSLRLQSRAGSIISQNQNEHSQNQTQNSLTSHHGQVQNSPHGQNHIVQVHSRQPSSTNQNPHHNVNYVKKDLDSFSDINLTPSLSAIINFAFNGEDYKEAHFDSESRLNHEGPLSPFTLNNPGQAHEIHSESKSPKSSKMLEFSNPMTTLGDYLLSKIASMSSNNSPVPSINTPLSLIFDNDSNRSLVRTSEQEQILHLYSQYTCSIMSIKNGANENPWRKMIIPLASKYPCLFNSIASMTLFHLAGNADLIGTSVDLRAKGYIYMKRCILELASGLSRSTSENNNSYDLPADIALATCLNLAVGESWDTQTSSGIAHLKGAKSMIQKVLTLLGEQQSSISKMKREVSQSPGTPESENEYMDLVRKKKKHLQKNLVLVDNGEWERMLHDTEELQPEMDMVGRNNKRTMIAIPKSLQFLFNIWIYFEVLAQMTTDTNHDDKGIDLVATITTMLQSTSNKCDLDNVRIRLVGSESSEMKSVTSPSAKSESSELSKAHSDSFNRNGFNFFDNFDNLSYNTEYVDPLLGCAQSLFLIMGKIANLVSKIRKANRKENDRKKKPKNRNSLSTITLATQFKQQLTEWKPTITSSMINLANSVGICEDNGSSSTWDISSCIATAESYRFSTLLYLHQAVPEIPSLRSHQLAEKIFILLASIPTTSHLYVIHIFPLLVSSCEAEPGEEREWCETRWALLSEKMWIGNIDRALEVVKEVWRRKDEYVRKTQRTEMEAETGEKDDKLRNLSAQISGLMAVINSDQNSTPLDDIKGGICSPLHWSSVMNEWGWEVLLG